MSIENYKKIMDTYKPEEIAIFIISMAQSWVKLIPQ